MPSSSGSLAVTVKPKAKCSFQVATMLFDIPQKVNLKFHVCLDFITTQNFRTLLRVVGVLFLLQELTQIPHTMLFCFFLKPWGTRYSERGAKSWKSGICSGTSYRSNLQVTAYLAMWLLSNLKVFYADKFNIVELIVIPTSEFIDSISLLYSTHIFFSWSKVSSHHQHLSFLRSLCALNTGTWTVGLMIGRKFRHADVGCFCWHDAVWSFMKICWFLS